VLDGKCETYWATDDAVTTPELVLDLGGPKTFNVVDLREYLPLGQRIEAFAVDAWRDGQWEEFAAGTSVGNRRLVRGARVTSAKVRLRITQAPVAPAIAEFGLYAEPVLLDAPTITRNRLGAVSIQASTAAAIVRYTTDRSEPTEMSSLFNAPIPLAKGGTIRARAFYGEAGKPGELAARSFSVSKARWKVVAPSAAGRVKETPRLMIDDAPASVWRAERAEPMVVVIDLGESLTIGAASYLPPSDGARGVVDRYEWATSADGKTWTTADTGAFANIRANPIEQTVAFATPVTGRYLRFTALHALDDSPPAVAELSVTAP
jgi:alpha-L-fucosidase